MPVNEDAPAYLVAALYRFVRLPDPGALREPVLEAMREAGICGTLLLAEEGINGTIAAPAPGSSTPGSPGSAAPGSSGSPDGHEGVSNLHQFIRDLKENPRYEGRFAEMDVKWSTADEKPFRKTRVRLKKEIVTLGCPEVNAGDPQNVGQYLDPQDWNALLDDPDVMLIDTRNDYEYEIGTFESASGPAVNPKTETFRQFPDFVQDELDPGRHKKVAMFCTGGIRCEKSTAYLKSRGFDEVYHLRGGILKYLEEVPEDESKFKGACFVFDRRVAVTHGLEETDHEMCFACGWPTTPGDRAHADYQPGVSCPRCAGKHTPEQQARFRMRQRQLDLAKGSVM